LLSADVKCHRNMAGLHSPALALLFFAGARRVEEQLAREEREEEEAAGNEASVHLT
jgi:hypothetical protein